MYILTYQFKKLEENRYLMGGGSERAMSLIGEARQVGLIDSLMPVDYQDYHAMYEILQDAMSWTPGKVPSNSTMDRLTFLQSERQKMQEDCDEIGINIENAKKFVGETMGYSGEAQHQKVRLESIGLFEQLNFNPGKIGLDVSFGKRYRASAKAQLRLSGIRITTSIHVETAVLLVRKP